MAGCNSWGDEADPVGQVASISKNPDTTAYNILRFKPFLTSL